MFEMFGFGRMVSASSCSAVHSVTKPEFEMNASVAGGLVGEEFSDEFNYDGGSVTKLSNGRYIVGFSNLKFTYGLKVHVYEVDARGVVLARIALPEYPTFSGSGACRTITSSSVAGEGYDSPF